MLLWVGGPPAPSMNAVVTFLLEHERLILGRTCGLSLLRRNGDISLTQSVSSIDNTVHLGGFSTVKSSSEVLDIASEQMCTFTSCYSSPRYDILDNTVFRYHLNRWVSNVTLWHMLA